jgi:hypothetical protein
LRARHRPSSALDLPAGKAVDTLPSFAIQSGLQIIAPADRLGTLRTPAMVGTYDVRPRCASSSATPIW